MRGSFEFPNGRKVVVTGYRGKRYTVKPKRYEMILFKCKTDESGHVFEAELGYRGNFWRMDNCGRIARVGNSAHGHKMVTLCDLATVTTNIHPE